MISMSRNMALKHVCSTIALSQNPKTIKLIEVRVPHRNLQIWKSNQILKYRDLSTEPNTKLASKITPVIYEKYLNLSDLGNRRQKVEVDGMMLNWDVAGTGDQVLLLLPGVMGTIETDFGCLFHKMDKTKYTLVSWDPPGYGRSRPPNRDLSGLFYRRDGHTVVNLMDKLGFDKFSVLGWSNGGTTALHVAADYPSRVEKIVTWCAAVYADDQTLRHAENMRNLDLWSTKMLAPLVAVYGKEYLSKVMQDWHKSVLNFYNDDELNFALSKRLPYIKCPGLFIHGEEDNVLSATHAQFLKDNMKNSQMWIMPKASHNLHLRYTNEFLKVVTEFLDAKKFVS